METTDRPEYVTEDHLLYLDELRDSAVVNMFGATEYIISLFDVDKTTARNILMYWMKTYGSENR